MKGEIRLGFRILSEIGFVFGNIKVNNDYYLNQLSGEEKESKKHFFEDILGRNTRYIADDTQNSFTLARDAAKKAIKDNNVNVNDIDMVICVSHTPEYTSPSVARLVLHAIGGKESVICFDINVNCTGMLVALDIADRYFATDENINSILIVQGDRNSNIRTPKSSVVWGLMSDVGCAVILKRDEKSGIKARHFSMDYDEAWKIVYPKDGNTKPNPILYEEPSRDPRPEKMSHVIEEMCGLENMKNIKLMCISQFAQSNWKKFVEASSVPEERIPYIGDIYGYTGASSPLLALKNGIERKMVKRGDMIVMWTFGAGNQQVVLVLEY